MDFSLLKFLGKLIQKYPCIVYTRVNILRAMNDMIENFPDKVICLLFSFFDKLKMETQCSDFLDGTSKGQVSRFRRFLQESICSWIRVVNDVADGIIY
ncbi:hypothetical protein WN944_027100 [Citrus x changshan-huyou]|uniref:Uncharacterized protein n=1 Tax=Citrus x changshan-huyou TaxID=2935761 RepID=A0AAP0LN36_9ROSI